MCDETCIFCFFPIIYKYLRMAKRSLLSRCPSYKKKSDPTVDGTCSLLKNVKHNLGKSGHFSVYGEFVACRVQDLNNLQLQAVVECQINTVLFEAEMELHNDQTLCEWTPSTIHFDSSCSISSRSIPQSDSSSCTSIF